MRVVVDYSDEPGLLADTVKKRVWILCDKCGEVIDADHPGLVITHAGVQLPATSDVQFLHKNTCDDANQIGWTEVGEFLRTVERSLEDEVPRL